MNQITTIESEHLQVGEPSFAEVRHAAHGA